MTTKHTRATPATKNLNYYKRMEAGGVCKEYSNEIHIIQLPILSPSPHTYIRQIT